MCGLHVKEVLDDVGHVGTAVDTCELGQCASVVVVVVAVVDIQR